MIQMIERLECRFVPKEYSDRKPWICCEPLQLPYGVLGEGLIGFDLPEGTKHERAMEIAEFLNNNITHIFYKKKPDIEPSIRVQ